MAFDDREYWRGSSGDRFSGGPWSVLLRVLTFAPQVGRVFGITIRVHITFFLLVGFRLIEQGDPLWTLRWTALLFGSVLLHEFGHCFACRAVAGMADDILMWPLGGLASCHPPQRPWPEFVTVIGGPAVTLALALFALGGLLATGGLGPISLNPFVLYAGAAPGGLRGLVTDLFVVNYVLLLFNLLLVFYPFDGGRLVQIGIWVWRGRRASLIIAGRVGVVGGLLVGVVGLAFGHLLLVLIGVFGLLVCLQQLRMMRYEEPSWADEYETANTPSMGARWRERREETRQKKETAARESEEAELDRLLAKVHDEGLDALTAAERRRLEASAKRKRKGAD